MFGRLNTDGGEATGTFAARLALAISALALLAVLGGKTFAVAQGGGAPNVLVPAGTVVAYAGTDVPPGWLLADGSEVVRAQHAALFAAIGTTYGAGNGTTTFNLPDYRGRTLAGKGTHSEIDSLTDSDGLALGSRKVKHRHDKGTLEVLSSGSHRHDLNRSTGGSGGNYSWIDGANPNANNQANAAAIGDRSHTHPNSAFAGEVGDTSGPLNSSAYHVVNYVIKD